MAHFRLDYSLLMLCNVVQFITFIFECNSSTSSATKDKRVNKYSIRISSTQVISYSRIDTIAACVGKNYGNNGARVEVGEAKARLLMTSRIIIVDRSPRINQQSVSTFYWLLADGNKAKLTYNNCIRCPRINFSSAYTKFDPDYNSIWFDIYNNNLRSNVNIEKLALLRITLVLVFSVVVHQYTE